MRRAGFLISIMCAVAFFPALANAAQENAVTFSILPGKLTVSLLPEGEFVVLYVDDATGTSQGWWVTVDCTCGLHVAGEVITLAGKPHGANGGPRFDGRTLFAKPRYGMGQYQLRFTSAPGNWTVTYGRGSSEMLVSLGP